jgi:prepilin-type N-terminal cleavage/methylation domain-containing protein
MKKINNKGFSMIELLVVATIMIILTTIALISYRQATQNSRNAKRKSDLQSVRQQLVLYRSDNGCYPGSTTYLDMLTVISAYSSDIPFDPEGSEANPLYSYTPDGTCGSGEASGFTLEALLEPDDTPYTVVNP